MKEVRSVTLSSEIYLQERNECGPYPSYFHPYCLGGVIRRPGGVKKGLPPGHPPPTTTPALLCPLSACENAAASKNNQEGGEEQNDAKVRGPFSVGQVRLP